MSTTYEELKTLTASLVEDHDLSEHDVDDILAAARDHAAETPLTLKEISELMTLARNGTRTAKFSKLPLGLKIFSTLLIANGVLTLFAAATLIFLVVKFSAEPEVVQIAAGYTTSTLAIMGFTMVLTLAEAVLNIVTGVRLKMRKRAAAGALIWTTVATEVLTLLCQFMTNGANENFIFAIVTIILLIALSVYLNPAMEREERLRRGLRDLDIETKAKNNTLGLADPGKGFIRLDFFNVFWTFVVCCILGDIVEVIFHMVVIDPGVYQNRTGLLFGPFSPIYGFGAVLMTIALNRLKDRNILLIFVICTIIGGAFEFFVSWLMEVSIGATAWDYHDQWLGWLFDGRTCPLYASMFGVLGVAWIKLLLPGLLKLINKIPWKMRIGVTTICATLMLANCLMTVQALDNWYERVNGHVPGTEIEQFFADNYNDEWMQNHFQTITIVPGGSVRG